MQDAIATLLQSLVSFPSVDGRPEEKRRVFHFVRDWLSTAGVDVTVCDHPIHPALIATIGTGTPALLLTHIDVVPAPDTLFNMRREGSKVFGRGVLDDKGPSAILMLLLAEMAKDPEKYTAITAVFTTDEEIGSEDGVERLVKEGMLDGPRCVIALDGGDEEEVVHREKGLLHLTLQAHGKSAHNAMPWKGENAIEAIYTSYQAIKDALHRETSEKDRWKTTVSIGTLNGGEFVNQVPGHATAKIDIRFVEPLTLKDVEATVQRSLKSGVTIVGAQGGHPFETKADDPLLTLYRESMKKAVGVHPKTKSEHGATDARFFRDMNVPIWLHYPQGGDIHTDNEWMDLASAERLLKGLLHFMREIAKR